MLVSYNTVGDKVETYACLEDTFKAIPMHYNLDKNTAEYIHSNLYDFLQVVSTMSPKIHSQILAYYTGILEADNVMLLKDKLPPLIRHMSFDENADCSISAAVSRIVRGDMGEKLLIHSFRAYPVSGAKELAIGTAGWGYYSNSMYPEYNFDMEAMFNKANRISAIDNFIREY